ncbi:TIGR03619 family F420-dependent LLM class oxidoreductase [Catenulispora pinisilvae]|uniref:TIGR03619 family F420-dependent LLM class oxidoreductase n=1 Tax=Catenulispora pinisilvae TaxID=2705253 RepID=UPI001890CA1E|nr:TIGR03619 family F420-dependent LLM class oxidoreductase [Catenulispora pinisilvae]
MRLGVNVPNFGPATSVAVLERWAHVAEGLGFDLLMMSDHVLVTEDVGRVYPGPFHDPFTTLAWLAGRTENIRLGTTVLIMPYRQPALTAQMAASLHRLSGGRFVLGVGVGWAQQEFKALGVPFKRRGTLTDEHLDEMHQIWGGGVEGVAPALAPEELPGPPVWIGGNSDAGIRRAVVAGQGWHPLGFTMDWIQDAVGRLKAFADEAGRAVPTLAPRIRLRLTAEPVTDPERQAGIGTLEQVLDDLDRLRTLGSEVVVLDPYHGNPAELERPEKAWRELAVVADAWKAFSAEPPSA